MAALAVCGGSALLHNRVLAMLAAGAWATVTMLFCAVRLARTSRSPGHVLEMLVTSALIPPLSVFWRICGAFKFRVLFL